MDDITNAYVLTGQSVQQHRPTGFVVLRLDYKSQSGETNEAQSVKILLLHRHAQALIDSLAAAIQKPQ
jgi:hypothetical protein